MTLQQAIEFARTCGSNRLSIKLANSHEELTIGLVYGQPETRACPECKGTNQVRHVGGRWFVCLRCSRDFTADEANLP